MKTTGKKQNERQKATRDLLRALDRLILAAEQAANARRRLRLATQQEEGRRDD